MNWPGLLFGLALAAALTGAAAAAFLPRAHAAALALAACGLGVAGMCLTLGSDLVAIVVAVVLGALVPAALLIVATLAPPAEPDLRPSPSRRALVGVATAALAAVLTVVLARTPWPALGGQRELSFAWAGSRLLSDYLPALVASAALLGLAATTAVALLRPRARRR